MLEGWEELKGFSKEELEKLCLADSFIETNAHTIAYWSDYSFKTSDGRRFGLFLDGDSIRHRLLAQCVHIIKQHREILDRIAGFILEIGGDDPPLIFENTADLRKAWLEHHKMFNVPLSLDEKQYLGLDEDDCDGED